MDRIKNIVIGVLSCAIVFLVCALIGQIKARNLREYEIANDCEWTWQGTMYGDDRDYICK